MTEKSKKSLEELRWWNPKDIVKLGVYGIPRFPHFLLLERQLAYEFLKRQILTGRVAFDVPVDTEYSRMLEETGDYFLVRQAYLLKKRIDMLFDTDTALWIIEIKKMIRASAMGQVLVYKKLLRETYKLPRKKIRLGVLAAQDDPTVRRILNSQKIETWVIEV